jgi:hypothetical protein
MVTLGIFSIWIRKIIPINPHFHLKHDDALMVNIAHSLISKNWLGDWNNLTLSKPPGYPFFLYISSFLNISPLILIQILVLSSSFLMFFALLNLNYSSKIAMLFFLILAFNPIFFGDEASRIYRDSFIGGLLLLIFSFGFWIFSKIISRNIKNIIFFSALTLTSFLFAILYLTKQDIVYWTFPLVLIIFVYLPLEYSKFKIKNRYILIPICLAIWLFPHTLVNMAVKFKNNQIYGLSYVEDYSSGPFAESLLLLSSLPGDLSLNYSPIDNVRKRLAYEISPSFQKLKRPLEVVQIGETNWSTISCQSSGICQDAGPWTSWQIRDAASIAITKNDPKLYNQFFEILSNELLEYCKMTQKCSLKPISVQLHPVSIFEARRLIDSFFKVTNSIIKFDSAKTDRSLYFDVSDADLKLWLETIPGIEIYWESEINRYNKESINLSSFISFLKILYTFLFNVLILYLIFSFFFYSKIKKINFYLISLLTPFLHISLIAYVDSHGGVIGLARATYLLESSPIFYAIILSLALDVYFKNKKLPRKNFYENE